MTRAEFDAIYLRISSEMSRCAHAHVEGIEDLRRRVLAGDFPSAEEVRRMRRTADADQARMLAALDQYEAAARVVPPEWLPAAERAEENPT